MVLLSFKRGKKKCIPYNGFSKNTERSRSFIYLKYDYHLLFSVNTKISIVSKIWFLKTYYLSNSFLQSQARKCSCSHSLRLYMFRCLDTGLDNSHQCLKKKKDMVRIDDNKISISYLQGTHNYTLKIQLTHQLKAFSFIAHGHSTKEILLKLIWPKLKMAMAYLWINLPFSLCRGIFLLSFKRGKETWICNLCKTTFSKGASKIVRRWSWNTITIHCSVLIRKTQFF